MLGNLVSLGFKSFQICCFSVFAVHVVAKTAIKETCDSHDHNFDVFPTQVWVILSSFLHKNHQSRELPNSYGGFLKWGYPPIINFHKMFNYKPFILGYPHFRKPRMDHRQYVG